MPNLLFSFPLFAQAGGGSLVNTLQNQFNTAAGQTVDANTTQSMTNLYVLTLIAIFAAGILAGVWQIFVGRGGGEKLLAIGLSTVAVIALFAFVGKQVLGI